MNQVKIFAISIFCVFVIFVILKVLLEKKYHPRQLNFTTLSSFKQKKF